MLLFRLQKLSYNIKVQFFNGTPYVFLLHCILHYTLSMRGNLKHPTICSKNVKVGKEYLLVLQTFQIQRYLSFAVSLLVITTAENVTVIATFYTAINCALCISRNLKKEFVIQCLLILAPRRFSY